MSKKNENLITALYCRLSIDDGADNESMSITNQKSFLLDYAQKNGFANCEFYIDDGFTGRNFNRPDFKRLINDIESKCVGMVITKDLSRLGRNYIEVGMYTDVYFPSNNIRFIAVNDGVDSIYNNDFFITPFKNIMNDMYSRDISKKVATGMLTRSKQGKFTGGPPPFGYIRDPNDHGHLILDNENSKTVREIYNLALDGKGGYTIAKILTERKTPREKRKNGDILYIWDIARVINILRNPIYRGAHVVCKSHQKAIRSNTYNMIKRKDWEIIENCHEAVVTAEEWDRVQQIIDSHPKHKLVRISPYENIFGGLIKCADCGCYMTPKYENKGRSDIDRVTKKPREVIDKTYFICSKYSKHIASECTSHKLEARDLHNLVLEDIKNHAQAAIENEADFITKLCKKFEIDSSILLKNINQEIANLKKRNKDLDKIYMNIYNDKINGVISEQRFIVMSQDVEQEQAENNEKIQSYIIQTQSSKEAGTQVQHFINNISQYAKITELNEEMLHKLIKEIRVGKIEEVDGKRMQTIEIIYSFVGNISEEISREYSEGNYKRKRVSIQSNG